MPVFLWKLLSCVVRNSPLHARRVPSSGSFVVPQYILIPVSTSCKLSVFFVSLPSSCSPQFSLQVPFNTPSFGVRCYIGSIFTLCNVNFPTAPAGICLSAYTHSAQTNACLPVADFARDRLFYSSTFVIQPHLASVGSLAASPSSLLVRKEVQWATTLR
jgi:hypothetical protein